MPPICFWWFMISQCTLAPIWGRRMYSLGLIPCLQSLMILYISSHQDLDIFDTFQFLSSRSWRFWYFSVPTIKIVDERHQKVENQIFYDLGSTIKLKCMVENSSLSSSSRSSWWSLLSGGEHRGGAAGVHHLEEGQQDAQLWHGERRHQVSCSCSFSA